MPADVERPDQILAGLTAHQVAVLAVTVAVVWVVWQVGGGWLPPVVFAALGVPILAAGTVLALGRRDGVALDRYVLAALLHARTPHRQVHAPEGVPPVPSFAAGLRPAAPRDASPPHPAAPIAAGIDAGGVIDLARDGTCLLQAVGTLNFALRTPTEQRSLIAAFAGWLNSLPGPVQIVIRSDRADLTHMIEVLRRDAPALAHPALERAAHRHADFLTDLAATRDLLHRQVLLAHHDPSPRSAPRPVTVPGSRAPAVGSRLLRLVTGTGGATAGSSTTHASGGAGGAGSGLHRRAEDATRLLAGADLSTATLDGGAATALLSACCHPPTLPRREADPRSSGGRVRLPPQVGEEAAGLTPEHLHLGARSLGVAGEHVATLAVTGYPYEVGPGWLEPLLRFPGRLDVAVHIEPLASLTAAERLRTQRGRLESTRRLTDTRGGLADPDLEAAAADAADLAYALARGQTRLFRVGIYLTVHAPTPDDLAESLAGVKALAESLLLGVEPATWRPVQGWITTLPLGIDALKLRRTLDTAALAAAFPFASPDLPAADPVHPGAVSGALYGVNATSSGLVVWDRWTQHNHNTIILARSGAGKSYLAKLDVLRSLYSGVHVAVIDPEDEYTALAHAVGGTVLTLGRPGVCLNPLDIPTTLNPTTTSHATATDPTPSDPTSSEPGSVGAGDGLTRRVLFAHTFLDVALGGLDPTERAALDIAVITAYQQVGITTDPRTWTRPAPLLGDVAAHLHAHRDPGTAEAAHRLAVRMGPFVTGSYAGLFNAPTTIHPAGHLVVFSLKDLPDETKTLATLVTLDAIWQTIADPTIPAAARRRRLVVVDEAWVLMREPTGAAFLHRMAKSARKYAAGLTVITQDAADLLGSDLGKAVVANAATQILMRQAPQAIDTIHRAFGLSEGETQILLHAPQGHGLLLAGGSHRVAFHATADPTQAHLLDSTPYAVTRHGSPDPR